MARTNNEISVNKGVLDSAANMVKLGIRWMALFLQRLRYRYKKLEDVLKYIYRIEIGKRGGIHVHILLNRTKCSKGTDKG